MSVSILDGGQEMEELVDSIGGLCNPDNSLGPEILELSMPLNEPVMPSLDEFCTCAPTQDAYILESIYKEFPKYLKLPTLYNMPLRVTFFFI